ncbi:MAG: hypothetical protein ACP5O7_07630 [Phycisphaerae bacterium]
MKSQTVSSKHALRASFAWLTALALVAAAVPVALAADNPQAAPAAPTSVIQADAVTDAPNPPPPPPPPPADKHHGPHAPWHHPMMGGSGCPWHHHMMPGRHGPHGSPMMRGHKPGPMGGPMGRGMMMQMVQMRMQMMQLQMQVMELQMQMMQMQNMMGMHPPMGMMHHGWMRHRWMNHHDRDTWHGHHGKHDHDNDQDTAAPTGH